MVIRTPSRLKGTITQMRERIGLTCTHTKITLTCTCTHTHILSHSQTYSRTHTHTHTLARTHTHTHTSHTHTHKHTHTHTPLVTECRTYPGTTRLSSTRKSWLLPNTNGSVLHFCRALGLHCGSLTLECVVRGF